MRSSRIKHLMILTAAIPALLFMAASCNEGAVEKTVRGTGHPLINYAKGFDITSFKGFTMLNVYNPWQGAQDVMLSYLLAGRDEETGSLPRLPRGTTVIPVPVRSVICLSTTHVAMLDLIDETGAITAVAGGDYIFNEKITVRRENGELPVIGYDMNLDYERILELDPDVILAYGVDSGAGAWLERLRDLGMNVVVIGEYLEDSPLAQAEWVKFVAALFGKLDLASDRFGEIESEYRELAGLIPPDAVRPVVMSGLPWRNNWFVPGGRSLFATLLSDAGGKYLWQNNRNRENFPVDMERVIEQASVADFWINTGTALSLSDISGTDRRLELLMPYRLGNLYNNNARLSRNGGNDYWESGVVNPHLILKDLIHILHPGLLPGHDLYYYREL